jgi:trigger factor
MNIRHEQETALDYRIHISLSQEDYIDQFNKGLSAYRRDAAFPGFRKGMAPLGLIRRSVGKYVLRDTLSKLSAEQLEQYIGEQGWKLIARPVMESMPESGEEDDIDSMPSFDYTFSIGLRPEFSTSFKSDTYDLHKVTPSDDQVTDQINDLRRRFFENPFPSASEAGDRLMIRLARLPLGESQENIPPFTAFSLDLDPIPDDSLRAELTGIGEGYTTQTSLSRLMNSPRSEWSALLRVEEDKIPPSDEELRLEVRYVIREGLAELGPDLYAKSFESDPPANHAEFEDRVRDMIARNFVESSEDYLRARLMKDFFDESDFEMPVSYLMRLYQSTAEAQSSDKREESIQSFLKWFRADMKMKAALEEAECDITEEDVKMTTARFLSDYFARSGMRQDTNMLLDYVGKYLENKDNQFRMEDSARRNKLGYLLRSRISVREVDVTEEEFRKLIKTFNEQ